MCQCTTTQTPNTPASVATRIALVNTGLLAIKKNKKLILNDQENTMEQGKNNKLSNIVFPICCRECKRNWRISSIHDIPLYFKHINTLRQNSQTQAELCYVSGPVQTRVFSPVHGRTKLTLKTTEEQLNRPTFSSAFTSEGQGDTCLKTLAPTFLTEKTDGLGEEQRRPSLTGLVLWDTS